MTTTQVVEMSVTVNNNSPIQDYVHPDNQTQSTFEIIKMLHVLTSQAKQSSTCYTTQGPVTRVIFLSESSRSACCKCKQASSSTFKKTQKF